jgi:hypothetical protein
MDVAAGFVGNETRPVAQTAERRWVCNWMHRSAIDLAIMALWLPFSLAALLWINSPTRLATVVGTTLLISLAHQPLTLGLIYGDPAQFAVAKRVFSIFPFVLLVAVIVGNRVSLPLVGAIAGLWNAEHTLMQRYGVVRIYGRKAGEGQRSDEKPLLFSWLVFALVWGAADKRTPKLLDRVDLGGTNENGIRVLQRFQSPARWLLIPAFAFVVVAAIRWARVEKRQRVRSIAKYLYLAFTFCLMVVILVNPIVGIVGYVGSHAVEYVIIVHGALGSRYRPKASAKIESGSPGVASAKFEPGGLVGRAVRTWLRPTGVVAVYLFGVTLFLRFVNNGLSARHVSILLLTIGGMHVFFDGFIWKLRRPVVARSLEAD